MLFCKTLYLSFLVKDLLSVTTPELETKEERGKKKKEGCYTSSGTPETLVHFANGGLHFQFNEWCKS